jgi:hypothetical protein
VQWSAYGSFLVFAVVLILGFSARLAAEQA